MVGNGNNGTNFTETFERCQVKSQTTWVAEKVLWQGQKLKKEKQSLLWE